MADKNIQEGDEVQWNYGAGHPTGTVDEVQTEGKLEIKTAGKLVHKNASPENPAVHVARKGNDVVKRASELTKLNEGEGDDASEGEGGGGDNDAEVKGESKTKDGKAAKVGDKRGREDDAQDSGNDEDGEEADKAPEEQEKAEKESGKEVKKAKTTEEGSEESQQKKAPAGTRKGVRAKQTAKKSTGDAAPKKRGPGRPRKSSTHTTEEGSGDPEMEDQAEVANEEAPAANTRSQN
ncbi:hypothetical protein B0H34DRAFT_489960 [Crassisporium funariophilum]|nr:hypothetical protein B0H34DRAFT_489960 [Crassisporium funariophilum]